MTESPAESLKRELRIGCGAATPVRAPRGTVLHGRGWRQEAALRARRLANLAAWSIKPRLRPTDS